MNIQAQLAYETDGAAAAHSGRRREDCPHPHGSPEWNHWVYGWDRWMAPTMVHEDGRTVMMSTAAGSNRPERYFLRHSDGRFTTQDGKPAVFKEST